MHSVPSRDRYSTRRKFMKPVIITASLRSGSRQGGGEILLHSETFIGRQRAFIFYLVGPGWCAKATKHADGGRLILERCSRRHTTAVRLCMQREEDCASMSSGQMDSFGQNFCVNSVFFQEVCSHLYLTFVFSHRPKLLTQHTRVSENSCIARRQKSKGKVGRVLAGSLSVTSTTGF